MRTRTSSPPPATATIDDHAPPAARPTVPLVAGALAGPLLVASSLAQGAVRDGFDFAQHPPSALALGDGGIIQVATFVASGALLITGAFGLRDTLTGIGSRWAPRLVTVLGGTLALAGVFRMDPAFGFPPGTPPGIGDTVSWHAALHGMLFPLGFVALMSCVAVFARRYGRQQRRSMRVTALVAGVLTLLVAWPNLGGSPDGRFLPMLAGIAIGYGWTSLMFLDVLVYPPTRLPAVRDRQAAGAGSR